MAKGDTKADCYLLDKCMAKYRRGRQGSVSTQGYATMIRWHYKLWREAMGMSMISSLFWTGMNLVCGVFKKLHYVKSVVVTEHENLEAVLFDLISFGLDERGDCHVPLSVDWECLWKWRFNKVCRLFVWMDCKDLKSGTTVWLRFLSL